MKIANLERFNKFFSINNTPTTFLIFSDLNEPFNQYSKKQIIKA
jgi:hypothetical protein